MFPADSPPQHEPDGHDAERLTVELYVRSLCSDGTTSPQETVIRRLSRLERDGIVDEYTVHVWGRRVSPDTAAADTDAGRFVLDRIEAFRAWAADAGMSIRSFFDTDEIDSSITGESYDAITVPTLTLAEFCGDDLRWVTPCADGGTVYTVSDRLDALEAENGVDLNGELGESDAVPVSAVAGSPLRIGPGEGRG